MKCPNCGAEAKGKFCEYCGSEMPKEKKEATTINITNNYYGSSTSHAHSKKPAKKRKTWLWVLGWICIFPVPLTILMLRKKNMKPAVKYGIIAAAWLLFFIIGLTGDGTETAPTDATTPTVAVVEQAAEATTETIPETTENTSPYAKHEATIRKFVDEFNAISDTPVTEIQFKNNHTIAYLVVDGFSDLSIKVNDHSEMGFFFTLHFYDGIASLEKYEALMSDIVKVFDANIEIGDKFQEANANQKTNIYLSDNIFVEYHYVKDAVGFQAGDTYYITLTCTDYNKQQ